MASIKPADNFSGVDLLHPPSTVGPAALQTINVPIVRACEHVLVQTGIARLEPSFHCCSCDITPWPLSGRRPLQPGTGIEGGIVEDLFIMERRGCVQYATNAAVGRTYVTGWYGADPAVAAECDCTCEPGTASCKCPCSVSGTRHGAPRDSILTHEANYHPDGGQVFASASGEPFVLLLARPRACDCPRSVTCSCPRAGLAGVDDVTPEDFIAYWCDGTAAVHVNAGTWHQPLFPVHDGTRALNKQGRVHACVAVDFLSEFGSYLRVPLTPPPLLNPCCAKSS